MSRAALALAASLALACALPFVPAAAFAQDKPAGAEPSPARKKPARVQRKTDRTPRKPRAKPARSRTAHRADRKATEAAAATPPDPAAPATTASSPGPGSGSDPGSAPPADVRTEGDTQVKMMEFSGLDIEGQLKTPQMLYFLNRMRAEFGRPRLPHRSFMPELQRAARGKAF